MTTNNFILITSIVIYAYLFTSCSNTAVQQDNTSSQTKNEIIQQDANALSGSEENYDEEDGFDDEFASEFNDEEIFDPLSGYNEIMTNFNDLAYEWLLNPIAESYAWLLPESIRTGINNFFKNLYFPVRFINNTLQLKFKHAGEELLRFATNTTIGILGLWDPAQIWFGLEEHEEDFGQTLAFYGVGSGFPIVIPFVGPSNLRDLFGKYADTEVNPIYTANKSFYPLLENVEERLFVYSFEKINYISLHLGEYENLKQDAFDLYPFLRDVYEQNRNKNIEE